MAQFSGGIPVWSVLGLSSVGHGFMLFVCDVLVQIREQSSKRIDTDLVLFCNGKTQGSSQKDPFLYFVFREHLYSASCEVLRYWTGSKSILEQFSMI
jgi:hypothetical protein